MVLIKSVLKSEKENDAEVIEDKTEAGGTEIKKECNNSSNIVAMVIWVPGSSSFFLK